MITNELSYKLFAIIKKGIVVDGWLAKNLQEAQHDHPDARIVEMTTLNSPVSVGDIWDFEDMMERNTHD